jgi:hypothetical protein
MFLWESFVHASFWPVVAVFLDSIGQFTQVGSIWSGLLRGWVLFLFAVLCLLVINAVLWTVRDLGQIFPLSPCLIILNRTSVALDKKLLGWLVLGASNPAQVIETVALCFTMFGACLVKNQNAIFVWAVMLHLLLHDKVIYGSLVRSVWTPLYDTPAVWFGTYSVCAVGSLYLGLPEVHIPPPTFSVAWISTFAVFQGLIVWFLATLLDFGFHRLDQSLALLVWWAAGQIFLFNNHSPWVLHLLYQALCWGLLRFRMDRNLNTGADSGLQKYVGEIFRAEAVRYRFVLRCLVLIDRRSPQETWATVWSRRVRWLSFMGPIYLAVCGLNVSTFAGFAQWSCAVVWCVLLAVVLEKCIQALAIIKVDMKQMVIPPEATASELEDLEQHRRDDRRVLLLGLFCLVCLFYSATARWIADLLRSTSGSTFVEIGSFCTPFMMVLGLLCMVMSAVPLVDREARLVFCGGLATSE